MCAKIMVVDDSKFMRKMLTEIFTNNGYEVIGEAKDGMEAIEKYKKLKPDLVTMDIVMPEMGGVDAARAILKHDKDAKIIMCTALDHKELVEDALSYGAKSFIVKPFEPEKVIETAKKILNE